jgi:hypothetical protein
VRKGSTAEHLVGRKLSSLSPEEAQLLVDTNPLNQTKILISGNNVNFAWDTEGASSFTFAKIK